MAVVNFVWMPGEFLAGDPAAWREETRSLLLRGELHVRADYAQGFSEPGQYYVRNERNGLWYSKYGVGNVLFTLPPMWLQHALGGDITREGTLPNLLLFNLWYLALASVLSGLLYALSARYARRTAVRIAFVLAVTYGTFLWFYQRAQASELYQVILFTALFTSLVRFLRVLDERSARGLDWRAWTHLAVVWSCAALLVFTRVVYGLLLPLVVILAAHALTRGRSWAEVPRRDLRSLAGALLVPPMLIVGLLGVVNHLKFGAPWLTGYHQWRPELHWPSAGFADGLWGFLFSPRFSVFLYFPVLALALLGWKRFAALHRLDAVVALTIFVPFFFFLASLPSWAGEWAYGPRYLLFLLPVLSLPALVLAEQALDRRTEWRMRLGLVLAAAGLLYSAYLQVQVNRLPFFTYYHVRTTGNSSELVSYFYDRHLGTISDDLIRHRANIDELPYFAEFKRAAPPEIVAEYREELAKILSRTNLYWALAPEDRR